MHTSSPFTCPVHAYLEPESPFLCLRKWTDSNEAVGHGDDECRSVKEATDDEGVKKVTSSSSMTTRTTTTRRGDGGSRRTCDDEFDCDADDELRENVLPGRIQGKSRVKGKKNVEVGDGVFFQNFDALERSVTEKILNCLDAGNIDDDYISTADDRSPTYVHKNDSKLGSLNLLRHVTQNSGAVQSSSNPVSPLPGNRSLSFSIVTNNDNDTDDATTHLSHDNDFGGSDHGSSIVVHKRGPSFSCFSIVTDNDEKEHLSHDTDKSWSKASSPLNQDSEEDFLQIETMMNSAHLGTPKMAHAGCDEVQSYFSDTMEPKYVSNGRCCDWRPREEAMSMTQDSFGLTQLQRRERFEMDSGSSKSVSEPMFVGSRGPSTPVDARRASCCNDSTSSFPEDVTAASTSAGEDQSQRPTTLMIRNYPRTNTQSKLVADLKAMNFGNCYDYAYLPYCFESRLNRGYAFINFKTPECAEQFFLKMHKFPLNTSKVKTNGRKNRRKRYISVSVAEIQGREANIRASRVKRSS